MRYVQSAVVALAGWSAAHEAFAQAAPWTDPPAVESSAVPPAEPMAPLQTLPPVPVRVAPAGPQDPQTDSYAPGPGRVPLAVESLGAPQTVGVVTGETWVWGRRTQQRVLLSRDLCLTPCLLHVRPGTFPLVTNGRSIVRVISDVEVQPEGVRVQMYAPSTLSHGAGGLLVGGGLVAVTFGTVWLLLYATGSNGAVDYGLLAGAFLGVGGAAAASGIVLFAVNPTGVAHRLPVSLGVQSVRMAFAPQRDGAGAALSVQF